MCIVLNKNSNTQNLSSLPIGPETEVCKDFPVVNSA